jgi:hypothetical protein
LTIRSVRRPLPIGTMPWEHLDGGARLIREFRDDMHSTVGGARAVVAHLGVQNESDR